MDFLKTSWLMLCLVLTACGATAPSEEELAGGGDAVQVDVPTGKGGGTLARHAFATPGPGTSATTGNGISYHGGPVMLGTVNLYLIWYGNWSGNTATTILTDWANTIGGSAYYDITHTYDDGAGRHVANSVRYIASTTDNYSRGTALSDVDVQDIVAIAINSGRLPLDSNGVYFVLTSADVNETSGFCTAYCGWHNHGSINGTDIKYSFVGNGDRCPSACRVQELSPNGNAGADGMASVLSHELEETTSDPDLNAWYDSKGENADKCAWTFGSEYRASNGSRANVRLGDRDFLIQQNWVNASGGYCALSWLSNANNHFYTMSATERDSAVAHDGYTAEGTAAYVFGYQAAGTLPLYRLLNPTTGRHFYTTSAYERDQAIVRDGDVAEGIAAYVHPSQVIGTLPLYRLVNGIEHLYTTSTVERDDVVANQGYVLEGVAAYVYPYPATGTMPLYRLNK